MSFPIQSDVAPQIIEKAQSLGASLAGMASVAALKTSRSHTFDPIEWPAEAKSALVLALAHEESEPELDWWGVQGGTAGNRRLQDISRTLEQFLRETFNIKAQSWPYAIERNGIFLKDATVLAGLGMIGLNNLLITPEFGPRVRLCALSLEAELTPSGPIDFSPCEACPKPCWRACPQQAFSSGTYRMSECHNQMQADEANSVPIQNAVGESGPGAYIQYCRACELACPVGK